MKIVQFIGFMLLLVTGILLLYLLISWKLEVMQMERNDWVRAA